MIGSKIKNNNGSETWIKNLENKLVDEKSSEEMYANVVKKGSDIDV